MIHMKRQDLFSMKNKKKYIYLKMLSAAVVVGALRVVSESRKSFCSPFCVLINIPCLLLCFLGMIRFEALNVFLLVFFYSDDVIHMVKT